MILTKLLWDENKNGSSDDTVQSGKDKLVKELPADNRAYVIVSRAALEELVNDRESCRYCVIMEANTLSQSLGRV